MTGAPYSHAEVIQVGERRIVFADSRGERGEWHDRWLVVDLEAHDDEITFCVVEYAFLDGLQGKRLVCWCPEGRAATDEACWHEQAVVDALTYKGDGRPQAPVNAGLYE